MQKEECRGFTLVELLIAVAIVAILTTVAVPGYLEHMAKSRRAEGRNALLMAAQLQERFYSTRVPTAADPIRYAQTTAAPADFPTLFGLPVGATVYSGENPASNTGHYQIIVVAPTAPGGACPIASCFVLRAIPNGKHAPDTPCALLTLSSTGARTASGNKYGAGTQQTLDYCWGK